MNKYTWLHKKRQTVVLIQQRFCECVGRLEKPLIADLPSSWSDFPVSPSTVEQHLPPTPPTRSLTVTEIRLLDSVEAF